MRNHSLHFLLIDILLANGIVGTANYDRGGLARRPVLSLHPALVAPGTTCKARTFRNATAGTPCRRYGAGSWRTVRKLHALFHQKTADERCTWW